MSTHEPLAKPLRRDISPLMLSAVMVVPAVASGQLFEAARLVSSATPTPSVLAKPTAPATLPERSFLARLVDAVPRWFSQASSSHDYLFEPRDGDPVDDRTFPTDRWRGG